MITDEDYMSLPSPNISIRPSGMVNWGQKVDIICSISTQHLGGEFTLIKLFGYFRERKSAVGNSATFTIVQMDFSREGDYFCLYETLVSNRTFISKGSTTVKVTLDGKDLLKINIKVNILFI
uniref:Immunoglobulin-like beta-sandwich domain-containing protein n=1 Tax=Denticeps clupeoides TaxID=299321 RepID=A0AAY4C222_9TELE